MCGRERERERQKCLWRLDTQKSSKPNNVPEFQTTPPPKKKKKIEKSRSIDISRRRLQIQTIIVNPSRTAFFNLKRLVLGVPGVFERHHWIWSKDQQAAIGNGCSNIKC